MQPEAMKLLSGTLKIDRESLAGEAEVRLEDTHAGRLVTVSAVASDGTYSLLVPAQEGGVVYAELPGYFPVTQSMHTPEEEAIANAMASVDQVPLYEKEEEADIRSLHLHLERLDSELEQLKEQRQKALSAVRAQNYALDLPLSSDPEIEALRHRYRYFTEVVAHQDTLPDDGYDEAAASDRELEDMQSRFKRYYVHEKAIQGAEQEAKEGDRHLWEEQLTFEALQAQAKEELIPEVEKRLIQNMEVPVKVDPSSALTESERATLEQKAKKLQSQIKDGLIASNAPSPDWVAKGGFQKSSDEPEEWENEVLEGLKTAMHDDVAAALAPQVEESVYNLVEIDGQYQVKKLERSMVRQKLDQQVATQLANEPQIPPGGGEAEEVAPLVPRASAVAPHYEELEQDLMLVPAEVGRNIPLNSVRFEAGTDRLLPSAYAELNRLLTFLNQHPELVVEAGAHAAPNLTYARALELTEQRAKVITNFLAGNGASAARLHSKGYGKAFPKSDAAFSERIEIRIIGKK
jgi:outer membrane protein OmpA-like peptidoglycan-associated protein